MNAYFSETKELINNGKQFDSFAKHFVSHFKEAQGNCSLCSRERLEIFKAMKSEKENNTNFLINSLNELYGACRHNPSFIGTVLLFLKVLMMQLTQKS